MIICSPRTSFREQKDDCLTLGQLQQIGYHRNIIPPSKRSPTPMEMFLYRSQTVNNFKAPGKLSRVKKWILIKATKGIRMDDLGLLENIECEGDK